MDFGVAIFLTDECVGPDDLARMIEERGFESLFVTEHTHIPVSRATPYRPAVSCRASTRERMTRSSRSALPRRRRASCGWAPG